jgi:hypothetical protein
MLYSFILSLFLGLLHPLHISVTEIEFDEKEKELEIVTRIFTDDLEAAVRAQRQMPELDLFHPPSGFTTDQLVKDYLLEHLSIILDGKPQKLNFLGLEKDDEAVVCYVQVTPVKKWKTITVTNRVLLEMFDDQANLVHITVQGKVRSLRLMRNNPTGSLTF